jgi:hypothetical protein
MTRFYEPDRLPSIRLLGAIDGVSHEKMGSGLIVYLTSTMSSRSMDESVQPRRYEDEVRAGLLLKYQFPHDDIKVREINSTEETSGTVLH